MGKDFNNDISLDTGCDAGTGSNRGGDLASDVGVDLNAADGLAKATMMSYEAPPPEDYTTAIRPPDYAIVEELPESHSPKTPEQIVAEMAEAWDYAGPANESGTTKDPSKPEHGDSPPDDKK